MLKQRRTHHAPRDVVPHAEREEYVSADHVNKKPRVVTAEYPNHVWHVDLTAVPALTGWIFAADWRCDSFGNPRHAASREGGLRACA